MLRPAIARRVSVFAVAVLASALGGPATAEDAPKVEASPSRGTRTGDVQRVFVLQHARAGEIAQILAIFPAEIRHNGQTIGVSAAPAVVAAIDETIKRLDVPPPVPRDVELTGYVVEASKDPLRDEGIPPELEGVVTQLKHSFGYPSYRLVDTIVGRGRTDASMESHSIGHGLSPHTGAAYRLRVGRLGVAPAEGSPSVRLDNLEFQVDLLTEGGSKGTISIGGSVDIRAGQYAVMGRSGLIEGPETLFMVLSAKVLD